MKTFTSHHFSFFSLIVLWGVLGPTISFGQNRIVRQNGSIMQLHTNLTDAINNASSGDTLYLSGGVYSTSLMIDKTLYLYGAGNDLDSTITTGRTMITGILSFVTGSSNSLLSGIAISEIRIGNHPNHVPSTNVAFMTIEKCEIGTLSFQGRDSISLASNFLIRNCVLGNIQHASIGNHGVYNNFVTGQINRMSNSIINNNIFFYICTSCYYVGPLVGPTNSQIRNNIFVQGEGPSWQAGATGNYFTNNILDRLYFTGQNTYLNNYTGVAPNSIFISFTGSSYNKADNYNLLNPNLYLGTDNTQVGVYGGIYPWRDGSMPRNPYIRQKSVQQISNNGLLNVSFEVQAFED